MIRGATHPRGRQLHQILGTSSPEPFFFAPLNDLGAGAVDLTLTLGTGVATFARATEAATRLSTGLWKLDVASGVARSFYHEFTPGSMTYGGYLSEPAATQLAVDTRDMTQASWVKGATMTAAQDGTGITGAANSCTRLTAGAVEATNTVLQTLVAAGSDRTYSCFIKRVTGTGTITLLQNASSLDVTALINTTSFVQVSLTAAVLNSAFGIRMTTPTDVILVDCNQFEAGFAKSTPIPAAGTRNADALSYDAANMAAATGTAYAECSVVNNDVDTKPFIDGGSITAGLLMGVVTTDSLTTMSMDDGGAGDVTKIGLASLLTGVRKRASNWGGTTMSITGDGAAEQSGAFDGAMTATGVRICIATVSSHCAKQAKLWKVKLTTLPEMTA